MLLLSTTKTRTQGVEHLMATSFSPTTPLRSIFQNLPIVPKALLSAHSSFTIKRSSTHVTLKLSGSNRHSLSKGLLTLHTRYQNHHSTRSCFLNYFIAFYCNLVFWKIPRKGFVRAATIEEIEAEKASIENDVVSISFNKVFIFMYIWMWGSEFF